MIQTLELELYIHIPFCVRKCNYCDFLSGAYDDATKKNYVDALIKQIEEECRNYQNRAVSTIYFGGGTPSVLNINDIERIMKLLDDNFIIKEDAEKTIEINPGTVELCKLEHLKQIGFNRASIGMQSANEDELKMLGRIHNLEQFDKCYVNLRSVGFENISVDIMTALPGQDVKKLDYTLDKVISLNPEHISAYSLIIEEGTKFFELYGEIDGPVVGEDMERELYWHCVNRLCKAGYKQYEISNFAKEGLQSRHNCGYWTGREYLGLGLGASSYVGSNGGMNRIRNTSDMQKYLNDPLTKSEEVEVSVDDAIEEFAFLGLRMREGISKCDFYNRFNRNIDDIYSTVIEDLLGKGLLEENGDRIMLTNKGIDYGNYVFSCFLND